MSGWLFAAVGAFTLPAYAARVCTDAAEGQPRSSPQHNGRPNDRPNPRSNDIDFVRSETVQSERLARSDSVSLELVSLNRDVLDRAGAATRLAVTLSGTSALEIRSVLCIRSRPEMLGLELLNQGTMPAGGLARVDVTTSSTAAVLYTRLPVIAPGESRHVLLTSRDSLAGATAISLRLLPKGG